MVYEWKTGFYKVDAETAGMVFAELDNTVGLTAKTLVEASRDESAPLHNEFEWDNDVAGELWREQQARTMICNLVVRTEDKPDAPEVRAYVVVSDDNKRYENIHTVLQDEDKTAKLMKAAMRELIAFERKYYTLEAMTGVIGEIEKLKEGEYDHRRSTQTGIKRDSARSSAALL